MATLTIPATIPSPAEDCEQLRKAFAGWGTNENLVIDILGHRNAAQRKLIRDTYAELYGKDLIKDLEKELSRDFERIVVLWTLDPAERDAFMANEATKTSSSKWVLMEIACTRTSHDILKLKQAYHVQYKKSLEEDVAYHTSGAFRKLLVPLVSAFRYEGPDINAKLAKSEAKILYEKITNKQYDDEEVIRILTTRSKAQISATLNQYNDSFGKAINKDLKTKKEEDKDEFLSLLRATMKCLTYPEKYFAKILRKAIKGIGTDEKALTRVVASRSEIDMKHIKEEFQRRASVPLEHAISGDTSGDYKRMLLTLIGQEN